jgi:glycosyltransferase involved in cell wall biosynthesis
LNRPRVLHVIDHTGSGGAQVVVRYLMQELQEEFSFSVAVLGEIGLFSDVYGDLGSPVFESRLWQGRWNPLPCVGLARAIRQQGIEIVHTHLFKSHIVGAALGKRMGCKVILHDHSGMYLQSLGSILANKIVLRAYVGCFRHALRLCDRAVVLTRSDLEAYQTCYGVSPDRVTVLPNGVDLRRFDEETRPGRADSLRQELGLAQDTKLVVMVARLDRHKDWPTFLQVSKRVRMGTDGLTAFIAVGSGPESGKLRDLARTHGLENVFFLGHRNDVPALLRQADIFLLTSRREPFGIVILEAMAAGCPVVATRSGGPEEIVTDGVDGLLAETEDVAGLSSQVSALLGDSVLRQRLSRGARKTLADRFAVQDVAARMAQVYREVLHN